MIIEPLYKKVVALDRVQHRQLRLKHAFSDYSRTDGMNAMFVTAVEFADVCREYPIIFVRAGKDEKTGQENMAPMAVLGVTQQENLYLQPGGHWRAQYMPAFLRRYPFGMAGVGDDRLALCVDQDWSGLSQTEGDRLFDDQGQPSELLKGVQQFVENYEQEVERTRMLCSELMASGVMQDMRFDATLPAGRKVSIDGFLALDDKKLGALPDAKVVEWHRSGVLGLLHAQQISMGLMRRLVEWHAERTAALN